MNYTKGPWHLVAEEGADFTVISTVKDGEDDFDNEVLGTSEWIRARHDDLVLISAAPELLDALEGLMASIGGGNKKCRHEFTCICAEDAAIAAITKAKGLSK